MDKDNREYFIYVKERYLAFLYLEHNNIETEEWKMKKLEKAIDQLKKENDRIEKAQNGAMLPERCGQT